jgi:hypothetical protein
MCFGDYQLTCHGTNRIPTPTPSPSTFPVIIGNSSILPPCYRETVRLKDFVCSSTEQEYSYFYK